MSDVLVYSGPGVSTSALHHTLKTLRLLLTTYDVKTVDARTLALDPWQKGTALVVLPGGRDLPYVAELAKPFRRDDSQSTPSSRGGSERTASNEVRTFVQAGGNFMGICAGAYYASGHCSFELGTPMQVDGERPFLRFYPGTCQGTVYAGFVYESDKGARIVDLDRTLADGKVDQWRCHYNGGGAFMDADAYADQGVEVLARYARTQPDELRLDIELSDSSAARRPDYAGQAAVVLASVGAGKALLFGTHPEFPLLPTSTPVLLAENSQAEVREHSDRAEHERQLRVHEQRRLHWMHELFTHRLGLRSELPQWALSAVVSDKAASAPMGTAVDTDEPKLLPIFLSAVGRDSDHTLDAIASKLAAETSTTPPAHLAGFDACDALKAARIASVKDSNDAMYFARADAESVQEAQALCSSADYDAFSKPIIPAATSVDGEETGSTPDKEVDLDAVPKYVLMCKEQKPSTDVLPYWDMAAYETHLEHFRELNAQRTQGADHWASWRAPFDPFNPFGSTSGVVAEHRFGTPTLYTQMVTSTQTMLDKNFRLLAALPVGTTFFATQQMSGRGRGGNRWISPKGCLQFSAVFRVPVSMASKTVFLQYLSGLAVVEGIRLALGPSDAARAVADKVRIKWPNDIYAEIPAADEEGNGGARTKTATFELGGKRYAKLGGILVNSQFSGGNEFVLVSGCGVNCLNARPTTSVSDLVAMHNDRAANEVDRLEVVSQEKLAGAILSTFDSIWKVFLQHGGDFRPFVARYRQVWLHSDQETTLTPDAIRSDAAAHTEGDEGVRIVGISSDYGLLQAVPRTSSIHAKDAKAWGSTQDAQANGIVQLQPDGNSFDMLQNLVKRKV